MNVQTNFKEWATLMSSVIYDSITPYQAKRLPPYITEEARNKAINCAIRVYADSQLNMVRTFERKQNEVVERINILQKDLQVAKQNAFAWFIDGGRLKRGGSVRRLKNELIETAGILDGIKIGLGILVTNKP